MSFYINSNNKQIKLVLEEKDIDKVFVDVTFKSLDDINMSISIDIYENQHRVKKLLTNIPDGDFHTRINRFNQSQTLYFATLFSILRLESIGFSCEVLDDFSYDQVDNFINSEKLIFDEHTIHLSQNISENVMMDWEIPLMKKHAEIITKNGGDILEIGFGMGISANFIQENLINSHTIIEYHPQVYERLLEWSVDKPNVIPLLGDINFLLPLVKRKKYSGIFWDPHPFFVYDNDFFQKRNFKDIVDMVIDENGIFSYFDPKGRDIFNYGQKLLLDQVIVEGTIPTNIYHSDNLCFAPYVNY